MRRWEWWLDAVLCAFGVVMLVDNVQNQNWLWSLVWGALTLSFAARVVRGRRRPDQRRDALGPPS
ncbi:MAG: hypothetical protein WB441_08280 [Nocardioidaceae bacterium]